MVATQAAIRRPFVHVVVRIAGTDDLAHLPKADACAFLDRDGAGAWHLQPITRDEDHDRGRVVLMYAHDAPPPVGQSMMYRGIGYKAMEGSTA